MADDVTQILIGPVVIWSAPTGEAEPDMDDIGYGTAWGGNWEKLGFTNAALNLGFQHAEKEHKVQQRLGVVKRSRIDAGVMFETTLSEFDITVLQRMLGGTESNQTASATLVGADILAAGGEHYMSERSYGFEGLHVDSNGVSLPVRIIVWKANCTINGNLNWQIDDEVGIPFQIKSVVDVSKAIAADQFKMYQVTAPKTA